MKRLECNKCKFVGASKQSLINHKGQKHGSVDVGRPRLMSEKIRSRLEEAAAMDATLEEMAFFAGIHRSTLHRWLSEDQELKDRIEELRLTPVLKSRNTIIESLNDPVHAQWYLSRKRKKEFTDETPPQLPTVNVINLAKGEQQVVVQAFNNLGLTLPDEPNTKASKRTTEKPAIESGV